MAINANYNLLIERNNSCYHIPEYTNNKFSPISKEFIMQSISDFNQVIRESKEELLEIQSEDLVLNEAHSLIIAKNKISRIIKRINYSVNILYANIIDLIQTTINEDLNNKRCSKEDEIEKRFKLAERIKILKKALQVITDESKMINSTSVKVSKKLIDPNFPNENVIKKYLVNIVNSTVDVIDDINDNKVSSSELIQDNTYNAYAKSFNNYRFDINNVQKSMEEACNDAYGSDIRVPIKITIDMYCSAVSNCENTKSAINKLEALKNEVSKSYSELKKALNNLMTKANTMTKNVSSDAYKKLVNRMKTLTSQVKIIVETTYAFTVNKVIRIGQVFGYASDSFRIKKKAHKILAAYINKVSKNKVVKESNVFNGENAIGIHTFDILDDLSQFIVMEEEMFRQNAYNDRIMAFISESTLLLEADDQQPKQDNPSTPDKNPTTPTTNNQPKQQENSTNNDNANKEKQNNASNTKNGFMQKIMNWLKRLFGKLGETMGKWKNRMEELAIKADRPFWEKHKDKIAKLNISDTKANQWFKFNIGSFDNSTIVNFDVRNEALKSDEAFQEAILKKINSNVTPAKENDTFTDRVKRQYEGEYINDENGEGKPLSTIGYNHDEAFKFVDGIVNGFSGNLLAKIKDDYNIMDRDLRKVNREYNTILSTMQDQNSQAQNPPEQKEETPKNASYIYNNDKYVLAESFGLSIREAKFTVGDNDKDNASNTVGPQEREEYTKSKPLDDMIRRCFRYNTVAITARMTCVLAAYKQYMGLFKAVFDKGAAKAKQDK